MRGVGGGEIGMMDIGPVDLEEGDGANQSI